MNPKDGLSGNTGKMSTVEEEWRYKYRRELHDTKVLLETLSIKQKEQLKAYRPTQVNTYALPINYII